MTTVARKIVVCSLSWAIAALTGCGGRTHDDVGSGDEDDSDSGSNSSTPAPTCVEICRTIVDRCIAGGAIQQCASDCEAMRSQYKGCKALDTFLRCMPTVPVQCAGEKVTIDGCYEERNELARCQP